MKKNSLPFVNICKCYVYYISLQSILLGVGGVCLTSCMEGERNGIPKQMEGTYSSSPKRHLESREESEEELNSNRPSKIRRAVNDHVVNDRPDSLVVGNPVSHTQSSNEVTSSPTRIILQLQIQNEEDQNPRKIEIPGWPMLKIISLLNFKGVLSLRKANGSFYRWFNAPVNAGIIARMFRQGIDCLNCRPEVELQGPFPILSLYCKAENPGVKQLPYLTNVQEVYYSSDEGEIYDLVESVREAI